MSCKEHACQEKIKFLCKDCPEDHLFCFNHAQSHQIDHANHSIKIIDQEEINSTQQISLQKEAERKLLKILNDSNILIRAFKETSQLQMLETKIKSDSESPADIPFNINELLTKLASENLIKKGAYFLDEDIDKSKARVKDLTSEMERLRNELNNKTKELEDLKNEQEDKKEIKVSGQS